jgi:tRNA (guanine37-N1)-methyltransferase
LPDVLGKVESHEQDSFSTGLLEHPHYTRPADFRGMKVPEVLLSGNHAHIEKWRSKEMLKRTWERRPDLFEGYSLTKEQEEWLDEIKKEDKRY